MQVGLFQQQSINWPESHGEVQVVNSERQLQKLLSELAVDKPEIVGLDTEFVKESMKGSVIIDADLFCTTLSWAKSESRSVSKYGVRVPVGNLWLIPSEWHTEALVRVLETLPVTGHNIMGADRHVLRECVGLHLHNIKFDTMHASRIYHHAHRYDHGLKAWAGRLDIAQIEYRDLGRGEFRRQTEAQPEIWNKKTAAVIKDRAKKGIEITQKDARSRAFNNMFNAWKKKHTLRTLAYNDNILKQLIDYAAVDARLHMQLYYTLVALMKEREL